MAIALVSNVSSASTTGNNCPNSSAIDTTGATLLVMELADYTGATTHATPSDSKGNTWTALSLFDQNVCRARLYYVANPTVGTGHTFATVSGNGAFPSLCVAAFSGVVTTSPADVESAGGGTDSGTSAQPGSLTPSENNELIIAGLSVNGGTLHGINSSFSITDTVLAASGQHVGSALAYLIQTSLAAVNPTWSWTTAVPAAARSASFKAAAAASSKPYYYGLSQGLHV